MSPISLSFAYWARSFFLIISLQRNDKILSSRGHRVFSGADYLLPEVSNARGRDEPGKADYELTGLIGESFFQPFPDSQEKSLQSV